MKLLFAAIIALAFGGIAHAGDWGSCDESKGWCGGNSHQQHCTTTCNSSGRCETYCY
jgi:hypothetical protein